MNIARLKPTFVIAPLVLILLSGCYPKTDEIQELYERQTALEARMDRLAQDLEAGLSQISQNIGRVEAGQQRLAQDLEAVKLRSAAAEKKTDRDEIRKGTKNTKASQAKPKPPSNTPEFIYSRAAASYEDGRYEDAILEYQKLIDTYPRDKRVPEAYLKQGLSLINLGRKQEAKYFLNTLIDKYPNSREAQTAREKLKTI